MIRRSILFLAIEATAWITSRNARSAVRTYRVALVHPIRPTTGMTKTGDPIFAIFLEELSKRGFIEGDNIFINRFSAMGVAEKYYQVASEAIDTRPDLIATTSDRMTANFSRLTASIPIATLTTDPVSLGFTQSLARPDKNITGVIVSPSIDIWKKRIQFLKDVKPNIERVFVLAARSYWTTPEIASIKRAIEEVGCIMVGPPVESPHQSAEYQDALTQAAAISDACIVSTSVENSKNKDVIVQTANKLKLLTIYPFRDYADAGGLIAHDINLLDLYRQLGRQSAEILSGKNIHDIPFYQPYKLRLIINTRTAEDTNIIIPSDLLARADELID